MAQIGYTPISLYFSATGAAVPLAADLIAGELALNTNDGKLYYKNSSNVVTLLAGATAGPAGGSTTQVQYNNGGVLAGITGATTNGTALTLVAPVLGTPASGTVTNLTGTASININGTVGATTATTGAFTTGTFSAASRFDSNLAVGGTPVQATRLSVKQSGTTLLTGMSVEASATDSLLALYSDGTNFNIRSDYDTTGIYQPIKLWTSGAVAMTIGAGGASAPVAIPGTLAVTGTASVSSTLLVGGAPTQSYYTTVRAIALASGGTIQGFTNTGGLYMLNNVYQVASTASWTRINAEAVSGLLLESGAVQFRYAATGLAGSTVSTFITSGSIDNSGNWTFSPGGSTVGSITSTGLAVTGTLSATSTLSTTGGAAKAEAAASQAKSVVGGFNSGAAATASAEMFTFAQANVQKISHFWANNTTAYQIQTSASGAKIQLMPDTGGTVVADVTSAGLAVTGTLSNSTDFTCGGTGYVTNMAGGTVMNVKGAQAGGYAMGLQHTNANPVGMYLYYSTDTNDGAHPVVRFDGATNTRYQLFSNGGISNYQANDSNISDVRTKKNIELSGNYLDKICAIPVKTFLYKDQTDEFLNLGVIAQDVEAVAPELINSGGFGDTPEDGVPLKSIYQTDLQFALMKAIQELAAKVAKLEAA